MKSHKKLSKSKPISPTVISSATKKISTKDETHKAVLHEVGDTSLESPIPKVDKQTTYFVLGVYVVIILLGIGTGYILAYKWGPSSPVDTVTSIQSENVVGVLDEETFKDSAEGMVEAGGIDGEGTHKLVREGGPSQTAYLLSSVVDLDEFVGKKVKIWGQTIAAQKASWLMDVGKVELLKE